MEIDYANFIIGLYHDANIRVYNKIYIYIYIYTYIFSKLLSPIGHLSTSRTPPHITCLHHICQSWKITFLPTTSKNTKREKYISVSNEQDDVLRLKSRANIIYGDSVAHTVDSYSNM